LNSKPKKKIRQYFIYYSQVLKGQQKLQNIFLNSSSNKILDIYDLKPSHFHITIFESLDIKTIY